MKVKSDTTIYVELTQEEAKDIQKALELTRDQARYSLSTISTDEGMDQRTQVEHINNLSALIDRLTAIRDALEPFIIYDVKI